MGVYKRFQFIVYNTLSLIKMVFSAGLIPDTLYVK